MAALAPLFLFPGGETLGKWSPKADSPRVADNRTLTSFRTPAPGTVGSTLSGVLDHKPESMVLCEHFRKEAFVMSDDEITYAQHHRALGIQLSGAVIYELSNESFLICAKTQKEWY